jgi:hypothetical protein
MCDDISLVEAACALNLEIEQAARLFARGGPYRLRDLLAIRCALDTAFLGTETALRIGCTAAADAKTRGKPRLFVVTWGSGEPRCGWLTASVPRDATRAVLVLPVDTWMKQLIDHITHHRAGAAHRKQEPSHAKSSTNRGTEGRNPAGREGPPGPF